MEKRREIQHGYEKTRWYQVNRENRNTKQPLDACKKVKENKGAPGIDGITVDELYGHMGKYQNDHCKIIG